ncbi:MAG: DNA recombination protein RmuC [Chrysiogenales bacterium]
MNEILLFVIPIFLLTILVLQILLLRRKTSVDPGSLQQNFESIEKSYERAERVVKDEITVNREEMTNASRQSREELGSTLKNVGDTLNQQLAEARQQTGVDFKGLREEITGHLKNFGESTTKTMADIAGLQKNQLDTFSTQLSKLTEMNEQKLEALKVTLEGKLNEIRLDNAKQLDQMRQTVDEKLQGTLEKRLGESFKQVSERLEEVHKGLGEMKTLATGVGDLKKVLTNVKMRGGWGEVQLGAMLEEVLNPDQFATNVATKGGTEYVEFAIKLPGQGASMDETVWLPIDAKFPVEDYQRLIEAQERADAEGVEAAGKQLENSVKACARNISEKYLNPPKTTDFGILYLPIEGLFAEVIRRMGLTEVTQRKHRVVIAGPTTLWSILNSLQMGFRTLTIQKRSSEVWNLLAAVKTEWTKYGDILEAVQKKLQQAFGHYREGQNKIKGRRKETQGRARAPSR